jgi:hypothetical protein
MVQKNAGATAKSESGHMSTQQPEPTVLVRRQWNDDRFATYRLSDVEELHWSRVSGGVRAPAPQPFVHGYVM